MKLTFNNRILLVLVLLLLAVFTYYKFVQIGSEPSPSAESSTAVEQIEAAKQQGESMWLLFRSNTCPPCVEMMKIYERLEPEYKGKIRFIAIDVNDRENFQLVQEYGITYIPASFIVNGKGELSYQEIGLIEEEILKAELDKVVE